MSENVVLKKNPYSLARFEILRQEGGAYVDKTRYIELLESSLAKYPFIMRPRRFGKTLFTQTLQAYYDISAAKDFERNFAGTYIGEHKTPLASSYRVLRLDFSGINSACFQEGFVAKLLTNLNLFCDRNGFNEVRNALQKDFDDPAILMGAFISAYSAHCRDKIYLIIDEYDQGANDVLATNVEDFRALTKSGGPLKAFYAFLKDMATNGPIEWIFITGVTSIELDSMTSGFSIAKNLSNHPKFASMFGFTEAELRSLIPQLVDLKQYGRTLEEVVARMKEWYNGYRFSADSDESVFNASMCLNYLSAIADAGKEPRRMLDPSFANSLDKIEAILSLGRPDFVLSVMEKALRHEPIPFSGDLQVLNLNQRQGLDEDGVLSALYYMGFLTFAPGDWEHLVVPNRAVGIQFFEYFFKNILQVSGKYKFNDAEFSKAYQALADGDPVPWLELSNKRLIEDSGVHMHAQLTEKVFQTMLSATLWFSADYRGKLEYESRGAETGFMDLLLTPRSDKRLPTYVIEVKHLGGDEQDVTVAASLAEAKAQAIRYAAGDVLKDVSNVKCIALVYKGLRIGALDVF